MEDCRYSIIAHDRRTFRALTDKMLSTGMVVNIPVSGLFVSLLFCKQTIFYNTLVACQNENLRVEAEKNFSLGSKTFNDKILITCFILHKSSTALPVKKVIEVTLF